MRHLQQQTFGARPIVLAQQTGGIRAELVAPFVEQQRILARPLRHHALCEPGHEDDTEDAAARLLRRADEHAAVAPRRRLPLERRQPIVQHVAPLPRA